MPVSSRQLRVVSFASLTELESFCYETQTQVGLHGSTVLDLVPSRSGIAAASLLPTCNANSLWNLDRRRLCRP